MICVSDFSSVVPADAIAGKVVDVENPPLAVLDTLFGRAGFFERPDIVDVDSRPGQTYRGNCNGGLYSVPKRLAETLFESWGRHARLLLDDIEPLRAIGKASHVDQIAFCMAAFESGLPFEHLPSNLNYPLHLAGPNRHRDDENPLALLHYHSTALNVLGMIEPGRPLDEQETEAVGEANRQIEANFETELFWDFRYRRFPERGSGVGSRGANLQYKRELLKAQDVELASSVLDVGCGDVEVVRDLRLQNYTGIDRSPASLAIASAARPDWHFLEAPALDVEPADLVLCFEVAIHQQTLEDYRGLIAFLADKAKRTLIVSGYDGPTEKISANHMLYYHEPLYESLQATGRFSSISRIGAHSDVVVYRCDVE
jgi:hypothetical protein